MLNCLFEGYSKYIQTIALSRVNNKREGEYLTLYMPVLIATKDGQVTEV